jgi:hypothetical protein
MTFDKDQSVDTSLETPFSASVTAPETESKSSSESGLASPERERNSAMPPPNGEPPAARAAELLNASTAIPDLAARAQMSIAMQQSVGNARMGEMLKTIAEPKAPPPEAQQPAPAVVQPAPVVPAPTTKPIAPTPAAPEAQKVSAPVVAPAVAPLPTPASAANSVPASPAPVVTLSAPPLPASPAPAALSPAAVPLPASPAPAISGDSTATANTASRADVTPAVAAASGKPSIAGGKKPSVGAASDPLEKQADAVADAVATKSSPTAKAGAPAAAGGKGKAAAGGAAPEEGGEGEGEGGKAEVEVKMPEAPKDLSPASKKRIKNVQAAAGKSTAAHTDLPTAGESTTDARKAVEEPTEETHAHAEENLVLALGQRPAPSPKIVKLCADIYLAIYRKRPADEDSLVEAKPDEMGQAAGDLMKGNVQGDVQGVDQSYDALDKPPAGTAQGQATPLESPPASADAPAINATQATPDAVPAQNVSLDADVESNKAKMKDAGMESEPAKLAQTGPVAEARAAQGELEQTAAEDPAKVLAGQKASLSKANANMAALQQKAVDALAASRTATVSGTTGQQKKMVGTESEMRIAASKEARAAFSLAQTKVNDLLLPLPKTAMDKWDKGVAVASQQFKTSLKTVADWIEERHSGVGGTLLSIGDYFTGLPGWVTREYDAAEKKFGDDVCKLALDISTEVNGVIMACEALIAGARTEIAGIFLRLPASLQTWAAGEQALLGAQLDTLNKKAHTVRDNFDKDLAGRARESVQEVRAQIQELRQKAKGLIGRIADAIGRFLDDPVKFIIEALLDILSIPKAAFWAVVAKIKKVIGQIADDPETFANNLMEAVGKGFSQFFDNIGDHLIKGFLDWLTGGLAGAGVNIPKDLSLKSMMTFFLELMGITWPRIRKLLAKHIGEENIALLEKAYSLVANLVALGPEGVFEMIREKLDPQAILDQIIKAAVDYMTTAVIKAVTARILLLFNPVGAILQALEAIYKVLKWIFQNAARIFKLIETIVNGIGDILAGNIGGMANAVEKALAALIAPVIDFLAEYLGFGDLPEKVKETILSFQEWIEGILDKVIGWLVEQGKALLKAVGLGGKEDEKDKERKETGKGVGETVPFTADGKDHRLWIDVAGANAVLMVASDEPMTIPQRLTRWSGMAKDLPSDGATGEESPQARASRLIGEAEPLASKTDKTAEDLIQSSQNSVADANAPAPKPGEQAELSKEEHALADKLRQLFELFDKKPDSIESLRDVQIVIRGRTKEDPDKPDEKTAAADKVVAYGYDLYFNAAIKRYHIQTARGARGEGKPKVHLDAEGKLQMGAGRVVSAVDAEKIAVYEKFLSHAGLPALVDVDDAETYRATFRQQIINALIATPTLADPFMVNTKKDKGIPSQYNRIRGDIYDSFLSSRYGYSLGPRFYKHHATEKLRCPKLETNSWRQPDGVIGNELYEAKGHTGVGPDGDAKEQFRDNVTIILEKYLDSNGGGPYVHVYYLIRDFDVRDKWESAFQNSNVSFLP